MRKFNFVLARPFDLQFFAEDPGTNDPKPNADKGNDERKDASSNEDGKKTNDNDKNQDKKYTDEDVDRILGRKFAEWEKKQQKKVDEAKKLAEMNAQEKAEYKASQLEKELNEYKRKDAISDMSKEARKMLKEEGINISDELLGFLVNEDAEKTKAAVNSFTTLFQEAVQSEIKEKLKGKPPKKGNGGNSAVTKESIMNIKDPAERKKQIAEHIDLFE